MLRPYTGRQRRVRCAEQRRNFVVHQLDDSLAGADCLDLQRPHGPLADTLDESARDLETHVRLEQVAADFAQRVGNVAFREHPATPEPVQYPGQLLGKGRKHERSKLNGEYPYTKWGSYFGFYGRPYPRDAADGADAAGHPAVVAAGRRRAASPPRCYEAAGDRVTRRRAAGIRGGKHLRAAVPLARLRARHRRSVAGRRTGRLVRGDGAVPPSPGPADSPHRHRRDAQRAHWADPRQLRPEPLPNARGDRREPAPRPSRRTRGAVARRSRARAADPPAIRQWPRENAGRPASQRASGPRESGGAEPRPDVSRRAGPRQDAGAGARR